jgi:hypothetical protein
MAWGQISTQTFATDGTFIVPPNVTSITVECWGAGGGGSNRTNTGRGGGGGGGAYARSTLVVTPGSPFIMIVGTGGTGGNDGENSSFGGTLVVAEGGNGGTNNNTDGGSGGTVAGSIGNILFAGGNGANGGGIWSGGGGGGAGSTGAGQDAPDADANNGAAGAGYSLNGGNGGIGVNGNINGNPGNNYGGGGSGARRTSGTRTGGSGADGLIVVTYYGGVSFSTDGNYAIPAGVTKIKIEAWGAGGGGSTRTSTGRGGGGGGGAYASSIVTVVPLNLYPIEIGIGGAANTPGGTSSFNDGVVAAEGGNGGTNNDAAGGTGGSAAASTGTIKYDGGNGANGGATWSGGGGGGAGSTGAGGNANNQTAGTGTTFNGGDGGAGINTNANGNPGNLYGGGGSGARRTSGTRTGGTGANGLVIITLPANVAISSISQVVSDSVYQGTLKHPVYSFETGVSTSNALLNELSFTTAGTYVASDITRFQLWYNTSNNFTSALQIGGNIIAGLGTGLHTFTGLNQLTHAGSTGYFWITTDITNTATANATISVNSLTTTNLTYELANITGSTIAGGIQTVIPVPRVALSNGAGQVTAANVNQGKVGHQLFRFATAITAANATLTSLSFTSAGTYVDTDILNFKLWYNTSNDFSTALQVGSPIIGTLGGGNHTFSGFSLTTTLGTTGYFWITSDIEPTPISGHTIRVNAITAANLTYATPVFHSGSTTNAGDQTILTVNGVMLTSTFPAVSANSLVQESLKRVVYKFNTIITGAGVTINSLVFNTSGTYTASDLVNFKLFYSTTNSLVGAVQIGSTLTGAGIGTGPHTFSGLTQNTAAGSIGYFWITADIAAGAVSGHVLVVEPVTTANLTYAGSPAKTGSTYAGGIQTIQTKLDTDNDGIGDIYDLDDDNDGIRDEIENLPCNNSTLELFPNSNFDLGNAGFYSGYTYVTIVDQSSLYPEGVYAITPNANSGHNAFANCTGHGNMMVVNGSSNPNLIVWSSGTIAVAPNTDYKLEINLTSVNPGNPAQLIFNVNGENIGLQFNATGTNCEWVPGLAIWNSGSNTTATFDIVNLNLAPGGNDFAIDDISCKFKIDCDSDGDGIPDRMDLDSDNDGIYDLVEAGGTYTVNGTIAGFTDSDSDGLSDNVDDRSSGLGPPDYFSGTPLPNPDTDSDGNPNIIDRESDGDGCFDVIEAGFTDSNNDGILGSAPVTVDSRGKVTSASGYTLPVDANSDGTRDYVQRLPLISVQPVNVNICAPLTGAVFSVTAINTGGTFQWQVSTNNGVNWSNLANGGVYSNVTTNTLTISNAVTTANDGYRYRVLLNNSAFVCSPLISDAAILRVFNGPPVISGSITGDAVVCPGTTGLDYSITALSTAMSYTWTVPAGWNVTAGQGTNAMTASSGVAGGNITVTATNSCGTSAPVALAVSINTPTPTFTAPSVGTVCQSADITYTTQSGKTNYGWTISGTVGMDYTITSGGTSTDHNLVLKWLTTGNKTVTVNYTSGGCQGAVPASYTINVLANAIIMTQPADPFAICAGAGISTISVVAAGTISGYQWQVSTDGGTNWSNLSNGAPYSNVTTATLTITNPSIALNNAQYRCLVTGSCGTVTSNPAVLTLNSSAISSQSTAGQTECLGGIFDPISVSTSGPGLSYQWYSNTLANTTGGSSLGIANGAQTDSYTPQATVAGTLYYYCIVSGTCGDVTSTISGAFVVNPLPTILLDPTIAETCRGLNTADLYYTNTTNSPDQYSIVYGATAIAQGFVDVTNVGLGSSPIQPSVPVAAASGDYGANLTVRNSGTGCSSSNNPFTIRIHSLPVPTITGEDTTCIGAVEIYETETGMSNYVWNITAGSGSIDPPGDTYNATVTWGVVAGQYEDRIISVSYSDGNGCSPSPAYERTIRVFRIPQTGPAYHIPNNQEL